MPKITIRTVKKNLAAAFPGVAFTYGKAGRGRDHGHCVAWIGGPHAHAVQVASGAPVFCYRGATVYHFSRERDEAEEAAHQASQNAKYVVWEADRPAREARHAAQTVANRAAGAVKAVETRQRKAIRRTTLSSMFPGVGFTINAESVAWTDGPLQDTVATVLGLQPWQCHRVVTAQWLETETERATAEMIVKRLARRLAHSKVRAIRVARGVARREGLAEARQLWLPFGPSIVAFNAHVMAAGAMHA